MQKLRQIIAIGVTVLALVSFKSFLPAQVNASCGGPFPPKPAKVWANPGPGAGQVTLSWDQVPHANRYAVAYGTSSNNYIYGADNIGGSESRSYTVSGLSGGTFYFRIAAANGCASSPFSDEVAAYASSGALTSQVSMPVSESKPSESANLSAWSGPGVGEVTVKWWNLDADNYHIVYDKTDLSGNYKYGALNIGKTDHIVIRNLVAGQKYNFSVIPVGGSRSMQTIGPVFAVAKYPVVILQDTTNLKIEDTMTPPVEVPTEEPQPQAMIPDWPAAQRVNLDDDMDIDEPGDVDEYDDEDDMYEEENRNIQGIMDAQNEFSLSFEETQNIPAIGGAEPGSGFHLDFESTYAEPSN